MSKDTGEKVRSLYLDGVPQAEISRRLNVSRQVVSYHLGDKTRRHRGAMSEAKREFVRAQERAAYRRRMP